MIDLGPEENEEQGCQEITGHKTGKQKPFRNWSCVFKYGQQKSFHAGFLTDNGLNI
jgi:hypothetical protein